MTRKRRSNNDYQPIGAGLTSKQVKRKKPINSELLLNIEPLTENQRNLFALYDEGKHLVAHGVAGSGKTFLCLFKALQDVLNEYTLYEKIYIVRSLVPTREIGC